MKKLLLNLSSISPNGNLIENKVWIKYVGVITHISYVYQKAYEREPTDGELYYELQRRQALHLTEPVDGYVIHLLEPAPYRIVDGQFSN